MKKIQIENVEFRVYFIDNLHEYLHCLSLSFFLLTRFSISWLNECKNIDWDDFSFLKLFYCFNRHVLIQWKFVTCSFGFDRFLFPMTLRNNRSSTLNHTNTEIDDGYEKKKKCTWMTREMRRINKHKWREKEKIFRLLLFSFFSSPIRH